MSKLIFRIRELAWWFVSELENVLYPYSDGYDNHIHVSSYPEVDGVSELRDQLTAAFEKIDRLQSEMIHVQSTLRRQANVSKSN
jgi:hypothetical protein